MQAGPEDSADLVADLLADQRSFYRARALRIRPVVATAWPLRSRPRRCRGGGPTDPTGRASRRRVPARSQMFWSWRAAPDGGASILLRWPQRLRARFVSRDTAHQPETGCQTRRDLHRGRHLRLAPGPALRHGVLLVLAIALTSASLRDILGAGGLMPTTRGTGILDRQQSRPHPHSARSLQPTTSKGARSERRVVKVFYEPDEVTERLQRLGWVADLAGTSRFIYGSAIPARETL
jgi:hypothetical protein